MSRPEAAMYLLEEHSRQLDSFQNLEYRCPWPSDRAGQALQWDGNCLDDSILMTLFPNFHYSKFKLLVVKEPLSRSPGHSHMCQRGRSFWQPTATTCGIHLAQIELVCPSISFLTTMAGTSTALRQTTRVSRLYLVERLWRSWPSQI